MAKKLRFAALIRVSTDKQAKKGESLRTQDKQITRSVESMEGEIVLRYSGQEHGTAGYERKLLDQLLIEAKRNPKPFDAVIVADPSRWTRDNVKNEIGLDTLRDHGIKFYVLGMEFILTDPLHRFMLSNQAGMNKLNAQIQKQKSLLNRIERAKRGLPTCGKLPFGRTFDTTTEKWGIVADKQAMILDVAKRYLAGERMSDLADEYGVNHSALHKILTKRSGPIWVQSFDCDELNIHQSVMIQIPPLLDAKTIQAILKKAKANKTYEHGQAKHEYLLTGFLFCQHCGYALSGTPNYSGKLYYRHSNAKKLKNICPHPAYSLPTVSIDEIILRHLFDCFGNPKAFQEAIDKAIPNREKSAEHRDQLQRLQDSLEKLRAGRDRILNQLEKDTISEEDAADKLTEMKQREIRHAEQIQRLATALEHVPTPESVFTFTEKVAGKVRKYVNPVQMAILTHIQREFRAMTFEDKRALLKAVFNGETVDGKPMGVYVNVKAGEEQRRRKRWDFRIQGQLCEIASDTDWTTEQIADYFNGSGCVLESASY